jgi:hypothetical protein
MADPVMYIVDLPAQANRPRISNRAASWSAGALLVALTIALLGAGLYWLQWSSLKGITSGYPKPVVRIVSVATGTTLINSTLQFSAHSSGRDIKYGLLGPHTKFTTLALVNPDGICIMSRESF